MKTTVVRSGACGYVSAVRGGDLAVPGIYRLDPIQYPNSSANEWRVVVTKAKYDGKITKLIVTNEGSVYNLDPDELRSFVPVKGETITVAFSD